MLIEWLVHKYDFGKVTELWSLMRPVKHKNNQYATNWPNAIHENNLEQRRLNPGNFLHPRIREKFISTVDVSDPTGPFQVTIKLKTDLEIEWGDHQH